MSAWSLMQVDSKWVSGWRKGKVLRKIGKTFWRKLENWIERKRKNFSFSFTNPIGLYCSIEHTNKLNDSVLLLHSLRFVRNAGLFKIFSSSSWYLTNYQHGKWLLFQKYFGGKLLNFFANKVFVFKREELSTFSVTLDRKTRRRISTLIYFKTYAEFDFLELFFIHVLYEENDSCSIDSRACDEDVSHVKRLE